MYQTNTIRCVQFSPKTFVQEVLKGSGAPDSGTPNLQTRYLAEYLANGLGIKTLLIEEHYIDRHFIEEYSSYYSRCLATVPNACRRVHAFTSTIEDASFNIMLARAASEELDAVRGELQAAYCGFIVVRPLPTAPIGRTVLRYPQDRTERKYLPTLDYSIHLLGFELGVRGVAFQQQDVAVAACATTAVWTALQRVVRNDGGRPPTPSEIAHAAMRHTLHDGHPRPGRGGLNTGQLCEALRAFNFAPELVSVGNEPEKFLRYLNVYIRSGIPIILCLGGTGDGGAGHAITVVGYRESETKGSPHRVSLVVVDELGNRDNKYVDVAFTNQSYDRIFVHDDRVGPYASAKLTIPSVVPLGQARKLYFEIKFPGGEVDTRPVHLAAVPLYPKLRSSAEDLWSNALEISPIVTTGSEVSVELYFIRAGDYTSSLYSMKINPIRMIKFQRGASFSRYVGIARWYVDGEPVLDTVWDTTDIRRKNRHDKSDGLLAIVALHPGYEAFADTCAEAFGALAG